MSTELLLIILIAVVLLGFGLLFWWLKQRLGKPADADLEALINTVFGKSAIQIAKQSKEVLASERDVIKTDLENKHKQLSTLISKLEQEMQDRQRELSRMERDRGQQFGELAKSLEQQRLVSNELRATTQHLNEVLSSNQRRGDWGERIVEDLLLANGLVENVHFVRQQMLRGTQLKPDITLLLPDERLVPVDVKFPLAELQKWTAADSRVAKDEHAKQFARDIKLKIDKVAEYIAPGAGTLDYAILFVPVEAVFGALNKMAPEVIDYAFSKRVLIVSPFTFIIVARTVIESYRNFMIGGKLKKVIQYIDEFVQEWTKFQERFGKYGRSLDSLRADYDELTGTRVRQMEKRIQKIQEVQSGQKPALKDDQHDSV